MNGEQSAATDDGADYHPATANALYIGAGRPDLADPRFPFVGKVQCVALYKGALTLDDVLKHFYNGNGVAGVETEDTTMPSADDLFNQLVAANNRLEAIKGDFSTSRPRPMRSRLRSIRSTAL